MNIPSYAAAAAKLLRKHVAATQLVPGERERGIETIERGMAARARRRRVLTSIGVLTAAAAVLLVVAAARRFATPASAAPLIAINVSPAGRGAELRAGDHTLPLAERALLGAGQRIDTPTDGGASLELSTGTAMDLAGNTSFRVDSQGAVERFSLQRGELSAHVAKLTAGQRFIVATPDAELEVRGTRFHVHVLDQAEACGNGSRTRLEVSEGVVEVRDAGASAMIRAGQHWPADCTGGKPAASREQPVTSLEPARAPSPVAAAAPATMPEHPSALTQQNDLFAEGVALRRLGDVNGALRVYQELITRFPKSPLAENAMVERMRALAKSSNVRARDEARRYLSRYPRGFAVKEAQQLTAQP